MMVEKSGIEFSRYCICEAKVLDRFISLPFLVPNIASLLLGLLAEIDKKKLSIDKMEVFLHNTLVF